jgi:hypothetical protein
MNGDGWGDFVVGARDRFSGVQEVAVFYSQYMYGHPSTLTVGQAPFSHVYAEPGNYTVTVTVSDGTGGPVTTGSFRVKVVAPPDSTSPTVTGVDPAKVVGNQEFLTVVDRINLYFSEALNSTDVTDPGSFLLSSAGPDGIFGTADDGIMPLTASYQDGDTTVSLTFGMGALPAGNYMLTVRGGYLHDNAGNALDGAGDGTAGSDYSTTFAVTFAGDANKDGSVDMFDYFAMKWSFGKSPRAQWTDGDFNGDGRVDVADLLTLEDNFGQSMSLVAPVAQPSAPLPVTTTTGQSDQPATPPVQTGTTTEPAPVTTTGGTSEQPAASGGTEQTGGDNTGQSGDQAPADGGTTGQPAPLSADEAAPQVGGEFRTMMADALDHAAPEPIQLMQAGLFGAPIGPRSAVLPSHFQHPARPAAELPVPVIRVAAPAGVLAWKPLTAAPSDHWSALGGSGQDETSAAPATPAVWPAVQIDADLLDVLASVRARNPLHPL